MRVGGGAATSGEAARNTDASSPLLFFGSRLRRQNFNHTIPPAAQATVTVTEQAIGYAILISDGGSGSDLRLRVDLSPLVQYILFHLVSR